jgi:hypothetical protein
VHDVPDPDEIVDLQDLVEQWGQEFAIERELAGLGRDAADGTWVSLAEAERAAGVSRSTLRTWYRTGAIASRLMPGPHGLQRLVPLEVVVDRAARSPRTGARPARATDAQEEPEMPTGTGLSTPDAVVRLAELATAAATARAEAAEARAATAEAALHAALERAAAAEAELRLRRATTD